MAPLYPAYSPRMSGTYAYAAGTGTGTVDVPAGARLNMVHAVAGGSAATLTIGGGATITIPANTVFSTQVLGATLNQDVVVGGTIAAYYIDWYAG